MTRCEHGGLEGKELVSPQPMIVDKMRANTVRKRHRLGYIAEQCVQSLIPGVSATYITPTMLVVSR